MCIYVLLIAFVTLLSRDDIIITLSHSVDGYIPPNSILLISSYTHIHTHKTLTKKKQTFLNPAEVQERIITVVKNFDKCDPAKVKSDSKFAEDLGLDSLDAVEVVMAIEDEFAIEIPDAEADRIASIGDAVEYIAAHPMAK